MIMRLFLAASLATAVACSGGSPGTSLAQASQQKLPDPAPQAINAQRRTAITEAVARVAPAVVTVQTEVVQQVSASPFDLFFGRQSGPQVQAGIGSGFIVKDDGVIVTNAHVVAGATKISVALKDGTSFPAKLIGMDESNDLAILKIDAKKLPVAPLGTSRGLLVGEWAIAIGNPYGFVLGNTEPSVTAGVISATGRNLTARAEGSGVYVDMIQTDASINPGNSGGPLVNAVGEVIGVNSSIYSPTGGSIGLGFAIPIDRARRVADDLIAHGKVRQPWIGVRLEFPQQGTMNRDALNNGAKIRLVSPGSPAADAGIQTGDILVKSRDRVLRNAYDWDAELLELRVDEDVALTVRRGAREFAVKVRVHDTPEVAAQKVSVLKELELITLTPTIQAERNIRHSKGALISKVSEKVAEEIGIRPGDLIFQINNTTVADAPQVARLLEGMAGRGAVRMWIERNGQSLYTDEFRIGR